MKSQKTEQLACTLIIGASSGMGYEIAVQLLEKGERVALVARRQDAFKPLQEKYGEDHALSLKCDIGENSQIEECVKIIQQKNWQPEKLFLNAGMGEGELPHFTLKKHRKVFEVNYFGLLAWVEHFLPAMLAAKKGCIVATSSVMAYCPLGSAAVSYGASKAALTNSFDALRAYYAVDGVRFICVHPGPVDTDMLKSDRAVPFTWSAERAATKILRGIEKGKIEINFPWQYSILFHLLVSLPKRVSYWITKRRVKQAQ